MTEAEWNSCTDPAKMLLFLRNSGKASDRRLRLFAVACCRRIWSLLHDKRSRRAIIRAEAHADETASEGVLDNAHVEAYDAIPASPTSGVSANASHAAFMVTHSNAWQACAALGYAYMARWSAGQTAPIGPLDGCRRAQSQSLDERAVQAQLLLDVFGYPFRPATSDPTWRTPTVLALAQRAYDDRHLPSGHLDPLLLAGLSDALEQVGCADREMLAHLRSQGPHWRGCWAVDLILGKA